MAETLTKVELAETPVFHGDYAALFWCLIDEMSESEAQEFEEAWWHLTKLSDRAMYALITLHCGAFLEYGPSRRWAN